MSPKGQSAVCPHCGSPDLKPDPHGLFLRPGTVVGEKYLVGRVLGHGGFGVTYLGWDLKLERKLAIKEYLPREFATRAQGALTVVPFTGEGREHFDYGLRKFLAEGQALVRFQDHPGIDSGLDYLEANGTAYLVMEYVEGQTLGDFLLQWPGERLPPHVAVVTLMQVMDALRALHEQRLVHRDVSPDNIYVTETQQVKLLDFGSVRDALREHSQSMDVVVKRGYSPWEQYEKRGKIGSWTDVYSVAATLYRALVGQVPPESVGRLSHDTLEPPSRLGVELPEAVETALLAALAVEPADRTRTIEELQQPLLEIYREDGFSQAPPWAESAPSQEGGGSTERVESQRVPRETTERVVTGTPPTPKPSPSPRRTKHPVPAGPSKGTWVPKAAAALVVLLLLSGLWAIVSPSDEGEQPAVGSLTLRIEPEGYATLDGFKVPDGGQKSAEEHHFSNLEPRTYRLKVWNLRCQEYRKRVTVGENEDEVQRIELECR
jgi:serine/threonine protein kinase